MDAKRELTYKETCVKLENLCIDESSIISLRYDSEFTFDHYDSDLKVLYVKELEYSGNPIEYEMLTDLQISVKEINDRILVGIIYENDEWGFIGED